MAVTTQEVAGYIPTRPKLPGGVVLVDFTEDTIPSQEQIEAKIVGATEYVYARTGVITDPDLQANAESLIGILAAMFTELGFYPEQVNNDKSPYKELKKLFDEGYAALIEALGGEGASAIDDGVDGITVTEKQPSYAFPETTVGDGIMP